LGVTQQDQLDAGEFEHPRRARSRQQVQHRALNDEAAHAVRTKRGVDVARRSVGVEKRVVEIGDQATFPGSSSVGSGCTGRASAPAAVYVVELMEIRNSLVMVFGRCSRRARSGAHVAEELMNP
jgi:hypothetical protein